MGAAGEHIDSGRSLLLMKRRDIASSLWFAIAISAIVFAFVAILAVIMLRYL